MQVPVITTITTLRTNRLECFFFFHTEKLYRCLYTVSLARRVEEMYHMPANHCRENSLPKLCRSAQASVSKEINRGL